MVYVDSVWFDRDDEYEDTDPIGGTVEDDSDVQELDFGNTDPSGHYEEDLPDGESSSPYYDFD